jgi:hypothetical protein
VEKAEAAPEPEPEPEPEEKPDGEPEPEPKEEEPAGEEALADATGEEESGEDGEEGDEKGEARAPRELPASALKELQKLRRERAQHNRQAPRVGQAPVSMTPPPVPEGQIPIDRLPVSFDDDGKAFLDVSQLEGVVGKMLEPSPQMMAQRELSVAEEQFVGIDPERNGPAAARVRQASEYLDLMSQNLTEELSYQPNGVDDWVRVLDANGITAEFNQHFPEIDDIPRFVNAMYGGNITTLRHYMDDYVRQVYADEATSEGGEPTRGHVAAPKVVPLPRGRPRSMAKKGSSSDSDENTNEARHAQLVKLALSDPIGFSEDKQKEMSRLARKLGIED